MKISYFIAGIFFLSFLMACSNDDSHKGEGPQLPNQTVQAAFQAKYPNATAISWEQEGDFQKAEFTLNTVDYETWYSSNGNWLQTIYPSTYSNLPSAVKDYIANSINYPPTSWIPNESTEIIERKDYLTWYTIELQKGEQEVTLWVDSIAYQHTDIAEDFDNDNLPVTINNFIRLNYSKGLITHAGQLPNTSYTINLLDKNEVKQVYFNRSQDWNYTEWPVLLTNVPEKAKAVLNSTAYENFTVEMVSYQQHPQGDWYHFILKQNDQPGPNIPLNVNSEGEIVL